MAILLRVSRIKEVTSLLLLSRVSLSLDIDRLNIMSPDLGMTRTDPLEVNLSFLRPFLSLHISLSMCSDFLISPVYAVAFEYS